MKGAVGRLERLLEFIGGDMMFDLIIDCPLSELKSKLWFETGRQFL